jgi:pimeloyl-ACP methyl ester carboxylesterase
MRCDIRIPRITSLAVLASLALGVHGLGAQGTAATTHTINVAGVSTRYRAAALDTRVPGTPLVVFQSGSGSPLEAWDLVIKDLGDTPVLAYDRPGIGGSSFDGHPPTPQRVNAHLRALLDALKLPPPYILVGHSWGGPLILEYAAEYPGEIAALVYVDASILVPTTTDTRRILRDLGATDEEVAAYEQKEAGFIEMAVEAMRQAPPGLRAEVHVMNEYRKRQATEPSPPLASVPTSVILAGRVDPRRSPPPGILPASITWQAFFDANRTFNQSQFSERLDRNAGSSVLVSQDASHNVQRDTPEIVIQEILRVVALTTRH